MFYKLLFGISLVIGLIVVIENLAMGDVSLGYFILLEAYTGFLTFLSILTGVGIGFGLAGMIMKKKDEDDNYDY
ncbi:MAG: hypothetical protein PHG82_04155 [Candidatus Gracilibacteria bacterium]|nr:hypothetical protein [Candidatus Gracilibacteria bacterium]